MAIYQSLLLNTDCTSRYIIVSTFKCKIRSCWRRECLLSCTNRQSICFSRCLSFENTNLFVWSFLFLKSHFVVKAQSPLIRLSAYQWCLPMGLTEVGLNQLMVISIFFNEMFCQDCRCSKSRQFTQETRVRLKQWVCTAAHSAELSIYTMTPCKHKDAFGW